ncbi:hypothetical protein [uncultured Coprobacter sp.]|uniref:hypothetical protein n=1 Tax=uncultured Coprobacter sp. TaxID=1720550 RepID=UPI002624C825|nr:hypothetical protein [uncultured Coprobacter sp.]
MRFEKITGLVLEMQKHQRGKKIICSQPISPVGVARVLGLTYQAVLKKLKINYFTVEEAFKIQRELFPDLTMEYLFQEQEL